MASSKLSKVVGGDMLSNLPDGVKEKILTFLPITEAGRTSILSSKWRYTWAFVPELTFPDILITDPRVAEVLTLLPSKDSVEFVDTVLMLHSGPIRKFVLKFVLRLEADYYKPLDRWIVNLSRNGIRELTLEFCCEWEYIYDMHPTFFSCYELDYIDLNFCSLKLPLHFKGFKLLHTLALTKLVVSQNDLEKLISSCPLLKKLRLIELSHCVTLNVRAPNLLNLEIGSCDIRVTLNVRAPNLLNLEIGSCDIRVLQVWAPNLLNLEIRYCTFRDLQVCAPRLHSLYVWKCSHFQDKHNENKFQRVLGNMPYLESFESKGYFLEYLCDDLPEKLPLTFNRLTNLVLGLDFGAEKEAAFVLALFHGCPHLQLVDINVYLMADQPTEPTAKIWETVDRREDLFKHLKRVNIVDFVVVDSVLSFVQLILGYAPQLVSLNIEEDQEEKKDERVMVEQILKFERASPNAKIIFK